uniref:Uncharacterized protein n=1 Tax=Arundo donax TaxID=35708 RepID=A0A0A9EEM7_ARUDO
MFSRPLLRHWLTRTKITDKEVREE